MVCFLHRQICVITDNHDRKQEGIWCRMENGFEVQVNEAAPMENITVKVQTQQATSIKTHIYSDAMQMYRFRHKEVKMT